jgi:hypothetical protein
MNTENHAQTTTSISQCSTAQQSMQLSKRNSCKSNNESSKDVPVKVGLRQPEADIKRFRAMTTPAILKEVRARQEKRWAEDKIRNAKIVAMFGIEFVT